MTWWELRVQAWKHLPQSDDASNYSFFTNEIKSCLYNRLSGISLSHPMKVAIESPEHLMDHSLEQIVNVWTRKPRKIALHVYIIGTFLYSTASF